MQFFQKKKQKVFFLEKNHYKKIEAMENKGILFPGKMLC